MNTSKLNKIILFTSCAMIISWAALDLFYTSPAQKDFKVLMDRQIKSASLFESAGFYNNSSKEIRRLLDANTTVNSTARASENQFGFLEALHSYAQECKLEITEILADSSIYIDNIVQSPYHFKLKGTYGGFIEFISKIESMYRVSDIAGISIEPVLSGESAASVADQSNNISMAVNTYYILRKEKIND